ncbi:MAG: S41 family peptidase [Candidatus Gracilibacteria bacterium]|nr:S41 family peptidase [Candidatus Gracilibacteria bacterium]MDD5178981.1 S41 family peptidase [Candidatus Gracilibacteria bacterium]
MQKNLQKKIFITLIIVLPILAFLLGFEIASKELITSTSSPAVAEVTEAASPEDLKMFWQVWEKVKEKYVDVEKLDAEKMMYGAMRGIVESLGDPHSEFMDPEESKEFLNSLEGSLTGIGAEVGMRDGMLVIVSPLRGSPAEKAGLLPGDNIFKIDGEITSNLSITEAVQKIRGEANTKVTLTIFRQGEVESRDVIITRAFIDIDSVVVTKREDGIAIATVSTFAEDTAAEFKKALVTLAAEKPKGVILDLRFNGGGFLDAAIEMASDLMTEGPVVKIHERGKADKIVGVTGYSILPQTPLVVLINEGSASSSEILAGALRDNGRAKIFGKKSFGKGTVQELIQDFADGSILRVTVAKWFTPAGTDVTAEGIHPDFEVELSAKDFFAGNDTQLNAAAKYLLTGEVEKTTTNP